MSDNDDNSLEIPKLVRQTNEMKVDKRSQPKTDKQLKTLEKARLAKERYTAKKQKERDEFLLFKLTQQKEAEESVKVVPKQNISEQLESSSEEEEVKAPPKKKKKALTKPLEKKKKIVKIYLSDSSETDSSSEEEVVAKKPPKRVQRNAIPVEEKVDYRNYFI